MATRIRMKNPKTGLSKDGFYGFSWTTLLFGGFPALFRGDFLTFIGLFTILIIIGMITFGIGAFVVSIVWAFMYNRYFTRKLFERGYVFDGNEEENQKASAVLGIKLEPDMINNPRFEVSTTTSYARSIPASLNRDVPDQSSEKYKLYLVNKFKIERNEVLNKFIVRGEIFSNIDEALEYCRGLEAIDAAEDDINTLNMEQPIRYSFGYQLGIAVRKNHKKILIATAIVILVITSMNFIDIPPSQAEELQAKTLGFKNAKNMHFWKKHGFNTLAEVNIAGAKRPGICFESDGYSGLHGIYDKVCRDNRVIWIGKVSSLDGRRIDVYDSIKNEFKSIRSVDLLYPQINVGKLKNGIWYILSGIPKDLNFAHPDFSELMASEMPDQNEPEKYAEFLSRTSYGVKFISDQLTPLKKEEETRKQHENETSGDGLTRFQWESRCERYSTARNECAVSANVSSCVEIKIGVNDAYMAANYCNGSTPNWSLMGMKP